MPIALDLLVEALRGDAIQGGQVCIQNNPLAPQYQDDLREIALCGW